MLINGIDLTSFGIQLYDRIINSNAVTTSEEWLDGDIQPTFIRQQDGFKSITLKFLVLCKTEEDAFFRISKLTQALKKATVQFDDINLSFDISMQGEAEYERLKNGNFIVTYEFTSDYGKGVREVYTTDANMTNSFKLTVLYYQNSTTLLATESVSIRASSFNGVDDTLDSIGIITNKYLPQYYNNGVATNLNGLELTYENLMDLNTLIINYAPISYNITVRYFMNNGSGYYNQILENTINFTYPQIKNMTSIGQLVDAKTYKPDGYKARIAYQGTMSVESLLANSPVYVYYDTIENEKSKNILINYEQENDNGGFDNIQSAVLNVRETDFIEGMTLADFLTLDVYRPDQIHYTSGYLVSGSMTAPITYETIEASYTVRYARAENTTFVEYYVGVYPEWYRLTTISIKTKYKNSYATDFNLIRDFGLDLNKYHTSEYEDGALYNGDTFTNYDSVMNAGVLQVYYRAINYPIVVKYYTGDTTATPVTETVTINALMFLSNPVLGDIIPINSHRPEGYQFSASLSYSGEITLSALTQASPITIVFEEIQEVKTKNIIVKYKKELASAYTVVNTSLITVNEADCVNGVRLKDIINLNLYKPEYYENGVIDGASSTALLTFEEIKSNYNILYVASTYTTPVRYYTDSVDDLNWIGSSNISYRVIDFETTTTLYDLGLDINAFKPSYCGDGQLQYTGAVNFSALLDLTSINIVYTMSVEPPEPGEIDYPHRFLFLQHNDLGDYENLHPEWTMNHAFINTGVSALDMSKLTVIMECKRVDENVPLHNVNAGYAYLFGSTSPLGDFYMRFNNQTQYGTNLTKVNTYEARAGKTSDMLTLTEEKAIGFGLTAGIYASAQAGYSNVVFTYTNKLQSQNVEMPYPLYLFANNKSGSYSGGLAGIGIFGCRIYYDNTLLRDMIPVQYYDKIGDQIAPSNCLYDKVTKTFFEDGTKLNSFNIIDDDRYTDTNLEHKIGHCYVNYYKNDTLFQTVLVNFRGNDFGEGKTWDPYVNFMVDKYQPSYYKPGVIKEMSDSFIVNFDNLNNKTFNVVYEEQANTIVVKYIKEDADGSQTTLAEETLSISEKDFYQVPTFGDIVRINKHKPDGYETNFKYTGKRVSLARIVEGSPYEIVYKPIAGEIQTYTTVVKYIKKIFGIRTYETIGTETLTFDQSNFRDGEYIDFYINFDGKKPEKYYLSGEPYEWYRMDERLDNPENLKNLYVVYYLPETQYLDINYYVDSVADENLLASTTWDYAIDSYEYPISMVDTLPNDYINKYKPVRCSGGVFENPTATYNFEDLVNLTSLNILYATIDEPHDPEKQSWENKVLYWGTESSDLKANGTHNFVGGTIPYIDLGYRPKELQRLRVEFKGTCVGQGVWNGIELKPNTGIAEQAYAVQSLDYLPFFGYYGIHSYPAGQTLYQQGTYTSPLGEEFDGTTYGSYYSRGSKGAFALRPRLPRCSGWVYTAEGPQYLDGQTWYVAGSTPGIISGSPNYTKYMGINGCYRRGVYKTLDDNFEEKDGYKEYGIAVTRERPSDGWPACFGRTGEMGEKVNDPTASILGNPFTFTLDAYNGYAECYAEDDSNSPYRVIFNNGDNDFFEGREQPRGTLSLFQATDPNTGKINIMPFNPLIFPYCEPTGTPMGLQATMGNPYTLGNKYGSITTEELVGTGTDASGNIIYSTVSKTRNVNYAKFPLQQYPQMSGCWVWGIKIYDRDKLVRDLIPVAQGDKIYNYVMPANGLFDKVTEIFFGNSNEGGVYEQESVSGKNNDGTISLTKASRTITADEIIPLQVMYDPLIYGKITVNYYNSDNTFIDNQYVDVPVWYNANNEPLKDILKFNEYKPDDFHLDGLIDLDKDLSFEKMTTKQVYGLGTANIYYKLRTFTKTIVYYKDNYRVGSKDIFYSIEDIQNAKTLKDLGINLDLYWDKDFKHGKVVFNESIIANDDIKAFIDAPSPIVVYEKLSQEEAPDLLYAEYYRGGAYDE